jgi:hypothetical protein
MNGQTNTGRNIADLLGGALTGATAQNEGQAVRGGMQFVQNRVDRDEARALRERQMERQDRADARLAKMDERQANLDKMNQEKFGWAKEKFVMDKAEHKANLKNSAIKRELFRQEQFNKIANVGQTRYKNKLTTSTAPIINGKAAASEGQAKYVSQKKLDSLANYARVGEMNTQLDAIEGFYVASQSPNQEVSKMAKENLDIFAEQNGWELTGQTTKDGFPIFRPPNGPYMSGNPDTIANLRTKFEADDVKTYNEYVDAEQYSYTSVGGSKKYMTKRFGENAKFSSDMVKNGSNEYAQVMESKPYWSEMSGFINTGVEFLKDDKPSPFIQQKMISELKFRDIDYTENENGKLLINVNDINESFNRYLPEGQRVAIFDTDGNDVYEPVTPEIFAKMRQGSGIQTEADKIYEKYDALAGAGTRNKLQEMRDKMQAEETIAQERVSFADKKTIDRIKSGKVHNNDDINQIAEATGIDLSEIVNAKAIKLAPHFSSRIAKERASSKLKILRVTKLRKFVTWLRVTRKSPSNLSPSNLSPSNLRNLLWKNARKHFSSRIVLRNLIVNEKKVKPQLGKSTSTLAR